MTNPFEDDGWGDLAAELGVDAPKVVKAPAPPPLPVEPPAEEPAPEDLSASLFAELPSEAATEAVTEPEENGEPEVIELGGTDEQKKRRRRRRRGKKKDGTPGEEAAETAEPEAENITQPSELLKDIIAHWDVPSWDDIVGGLYRPNR